MDFVFAIKKEFFILEPLDGSAAKNPQESLSENSGRGKAQDAAQLPEWMAKALMIAFILGMLAWRLRLPAVRGPLELGVAGPSRSLH